MIHVEMRKKEGGDYEATAKDGLPEMVEITGFSERYPAEALRRLINALETFGITDDLHVSLLDGGATRFYCDSGSYDEVGGDWDDEGYESTLQ